MPHCLSGSLPVDTVPTDSHGEDGASATPWWKNQPVIKPAHALRNLRRLVDFVRPLHASASVCHEDAPVPSLT